MHTEGCLSDEHPCYSNVAIYVPDLGWRVPTRYGLAYVLASAVVKFNRFLQTSVVRCCLLGLAAAYLDDELADSFGKDSAVSQVGLRLVFRSWGAPPQPAKSFAPDRSRYYLGTSVYVGNIVSEGLIRFF